MHLFFDIHAEIDFFQGDNLGSFYELVAQPAYQENRDAAVGRDGAVPVDCFAGEGPVILTADQGITLLVGDTPRFPGS